MELYKLGSRGEVVKQIQKALHLYPDGIFGKLTEAAVMDFQKSVGLKPDGIVGPATLAKLIPCRWKKSKRTIKEIIIHCTATPEGRDVTIGDITRWHKERGFSTIGYHYVIYRDGTVHEGRDVDLIGAHCTNHNSYSIGVCYVGGLKYIPNVKADKLPAKDTRNEKQKAAMLSLLLDLKKLYPNAKIYGHRDFANKSCPCFDAKNEYKNL